MKITISLILLTFLATVGAGVNLRGVSFREKTKLSLWFMRQDRNIGYTAAGPDGVRVYDLANLNDIKTIGTYKIGDVWRIVLSPTHNDVLYAVGPQKLYVFDRSDPASLRLISAPDHSTNYGLRQLFSAEIDGDSFFVGTLTNPPPESEWFSHVWKLDLTDRFNPVFIGMYRMSTRRVVTAVFPGNDGYYFSDADGLHIYTVPEGTNGAMMRTRRVYTMLGSVHPGFAFLQQFVFYQSMNFLFTARKSVLNVYVKDGRWSYEWSGWSLDQGGTITDMSADEGSQRLYVVVSSKIMVYSLANAAQPVLVSSTPIVGGILLSVSPRAVFFSSSNSFYRLESSTVLNSLPLPELYPGKAHIISRSKAFFFQEDGIDVYGRFRVLDYYHYPFEVRAFASVGNQLYVAAATEILVLDIEFRPVLLHRILYSEVQALHIAGGLLYAACGKAGLAVFSINENLIRKIGSYNTPNDARAVAVSGTTAYIADGDSLQVLDVCEPSSPKFLAKLDIAGARDVLFKDTVVYVLSDGKLHIVMASNPSALSFTTQDVHAHAEMALSGSSLFITTASAVVIRDISTPLVPTIVGSTGDFSPALGAPSLHASSDAVALADSVFGNRMFDFDADAPASLSYDIGCFADYRALKSRRVATPPQQCLAFCNTAGHTHAGTLFTNECWCGGASELAQSVRTNAADCATSGHRNMAVKSSVRFSHVGCFEDNVGRTAYVSAGMSVEHCAAYCGGDTVRNYKFFGIQKGDTCWCTQDIRSKPPAASGDCNAPCIGNGEAFCGGTFRSNMYALNSMDFTVGVVTASETNAESQHTYPIEVEYWDGSVQVVGSVAAPAQGSVHVMTATGILQHPRKVRIRAQGGDGWKVHAVTMTFAGSGANWLTDGVLGKVVKNTPGSEVVEWTAPPGSS